MIKTFKSYPLLHPRGGHPACEIGSRPEPRTLDGNSSPKPPQAQPSRPAPRPVEAAPGAPICHTSSNADHFFRTFSPGEFDVIGWFKERKRRKRLNAPFPAPWLDVLEGNIAHYGKLDDAEKSRLHDFVQIFIPEKNWEGCGGILLDDEIRVTIAGQAGLLALGLPHQFYANVPSILVYPSTIMTPERQTGTFEIPRLQTTSGIPILGEAQLRGPVILVWDTVKRNARHPEEGHNVVYHEFAHKLDMLDGTADGTPLLENRKALNRWVEICHAEFNTLRERASRGLPTYLDKYGATNEAEFFAVATEYFFDKPKDMERHEAALYELLRDFYHQDPARRERRR